MRATTLYLMAVSLLVTAPAGEIAIGLVRTACGRVTRGDIDAKDNYDSHICLQNSFTIYSGLGLFLIHGLAPKII
uniref:Putative secreted protein with basic tail n=1 Tax=Ixodes ricinus TaxID=34613 RepID=A0A6B0U3H4_IXORI